MKARSFIEESHLGQDTVNELGPALVESTPGSRGFLGVGHRPIFIGGVENGSVRLKDVERLLNATMPETKTTSWVNSALIGQVC